MRYLFLFFMFPALSHAGWIKSKPLGRCTGELFHEADIQPVNWTRGKDTISVCAFEKTETGKTLRTNEAFEVSAVLNGKRILLADEPEVGANPIELEFGETDVKITRFQESNGPAVYTQAINCKAKCELSKESCTLKSNPKVKQLMSRIEAELKAVSTPEKQLKVWRNYFYDGPRYNDGRIVISEAMLGDDRARKLALNAPGADGGASESVGETDLNIQRIRKICGTRHAP